MYVSYESALEMTGLISLSKRCSAPLLRFAQVSAHHPVHGPRMFPENQDIHNPRDKEKLNVNFARGAVYFNSTIPTAQRLLNAAGGHNYTTERRYITVDIWFILSK